MALALTHIWLLVDDMPRALNFSRDLLGLLGLPVHSDLGGYVELGADPESTLMPVGGQRATLSFEVAALDQLCAELRAKGVAFASAEADHPAWGLRTAFLHDPDGNLLCLYTDTSQSPPSRT